ncbi:MAG: hypothetical protein KQH59_15360 [Desulfobulbaceae bacterium]|nr:hypothetical protein [Desulfobulbaceae bacterium]
MNNFNHKMSVPQVLRDRKAWLVYKLVQKPDKPKPDKVPYSPVTGKMASTTIASDWSPFEQAEKALSNGGGYDGMGIVFFGDGLAGVDIDDCRDPETGEIDNRVLDIINQFCTYTEVSPSGTGVHMVFRTSHKHRGINDRSRKIEIYTTGRYFTFTGQVLPGFDEVRDCTEQHRQLQQSCKTRDDDRAAGVESDDSALTADDIMLCDRVSASGQGAKFRQLMAGEWQGGEYPSQSEADMALCSILAWWTQDSKQIDRVFRSSGLMRPKWNSKRSGSTYGADTIGRAMQLNEDREDSSGHSGHSGQSGHSGVTGSHSGQFSGQNDRDHGDISNDVREYVTGHTGEVKFSQLCQDIGLSSRRDKKTANDAINYMVKTGELEKHPVKRGVYLPTEPGLEIMTPAIEKRVPLPLTFPLGLHNHFNIMPGTVIVIGGATNAGKTIMGMEISRRWVRQLSGKLADPLRSTPPTHFVRSVGGSPEELDHRLAAIAKTGIRYLNCEMTAEELGALLADLGDDGDMLKQHVQWVNRKHDFPRAVLTDGITICDYLQIHRDFYEVGETIAQMADRVGAGILVVMIQKKSGESFPRGGEFALERARIALLLDSVTQNVKSCYLRKIKYPADARNHPERKEVEYRIGEELAIKPVSDLRWLDNKQRERVYKEYTLQNIADDLR